MERTIIIQTMIKYLKDKEKVDYDEILKYIHNNEIAGCKLNNTIEINDCIFDLIVEGILKVGIVYSYT
ncbi:MAG: hypothetical protein N2448_04840, partial [Caloramator sp.]|nr:hypothetical protein [Caloramator sp.]